MTINQYLETKVATNKEIKDNFVLESTREMPTETYHSVCWNQHCNDRLNNYQLRGESWMYVQYCWKCSRINLRYKAEPMGGGNPNDLVETYRER